MPNDKSELSVQLHSDATLAKQFNDQGRSSDNRTLDLEYIMPIIGMPSNNNQRDPNTVGNVLYGRYLDGNNRFVSPKDLLKKTKDDIGAMNLKIDYSVAESLLTKPALIIKADHRGHFYCMVKKSPNEYIIIDTLNNSADYEALKNGVLAKNPNAKFEVIPDVHDNGIDNCAVHAIVNTELALYAIDKIKDKPDIKITDLIKPRRRIPSGNGNKQDKFETPSEAYQRAEDINYFADQILRPYLHEQVSIEDVKAKYANLMSSLKTNIDNNLKKIPNPLKKNAEKKRKIEADETQNIKNPKIQPLKKIDGILVDNSREEQVLPQTLNINSNISPFTLEEEKPTSNTNLEQRLSLKTNQLEEFYKQDLVDYLTYDLQLINNPLKEGQRIKDLLQGTEIVVDEYIKQLDTEPSKEFELHDKYLIQITNIIFDNVEKMKHNVNSNNASSRIQKEQTITHDYSTRR